MLCGKFVVFVVRGGVGGGEGAVAIRASVRGGRWGNWGPTELRVWGFRPSSGVFQKRSESRVAK